MIVVQSTRAAAQSNLLYAKGLSRLFGGKLGWAALPDHPNLTHEGLVLALGPVKLVLQLAHVVFAGAQLGFNEVGRAAAAGQEQNTGSRN